MQYLLFMDGLDQYLFVYCIVQVVALLFLFVAYINTRLARLLFALMFFYAAGINLYLGLTSPDVYLTYAPMALPFYRSFIEGWFSHHNYLVVPCIAAGQFFIGLGMTLKGFWVKGACIGAIVFLLSIAPLMVGSGFPFSIFVSIAAWLVLRHDKKDYLWHKPISAKVFAD